MTARMSFTLALRWLAVIATGLFLLVVLWKDPPRDGDGVVIATTWKGRDAA